MIFAGLGRSVSLFFSVLVLAGGLASCSNQDAGSASDKIAEDVAAAADASTDASTNASTDTAAEPPTANGGGAPVLHLDGSQDGDSERWCDAIGSVLSAADCAYVTLQRERIQAGLAAPKVPEVMTLEKPEQVSLLIGRGRDARQRIQDILSTNEEVGPTVPVMLSQRVTAKLTGPAFDITPLDAPEKNLGLLQSAVWIWDVTPKREGRQTLTLEITSLAVDRTGNTYPIEGTQKQIVVRVDVTPDHKRKAFFNRLAGFAQDSLPVLESWEKWFGALALLITAVFGVWWAIRRGRSGE